MKTGRSTVEWSSQWVIEGSTPDASVATAANAPIASTSSWALGRRTDDLRKGATRRNLPAGPAVNPASGRSDLGRHVGGAQPARHGGEQLPRKAGDVVDEAGELALTQHDELHRCLRDRGRVA